MFAIYIGVKLMTFPKKVCITVLHLTYGCLEQPALNIKRHLRQRKTCEACFKISGLTDFGYFIIDNSKIKRWVELSSKNRAVRIPTGPVYN